MNGLEHIKLNIRVSYMLLEAIRACQRMHRKIQELVEVDPYEQLDPILYDLYGTLPLTIHALKLQCAETPEGIEELQRRSDTCVAILQQELRANHRIDEMWLMIARQVMPWAKVGKSLPR